MQGWIKLYRCLTEKAIWADTTPEQKAILITLLLMANHKEQEWIWKGRKFKAKPGQFVTSLENIAIKAGKGVSVKNVRTALDKFEKLGFLANESTKTGRLITIVNWEEYQHEDSSTGKDIGNQPAKNRQRGGKEVATNKNDKNGENDKNENIYVPQADDVWNYYHEKISSLGKARKKTEKKIRHIKARLDDGFTPEQLKKVIDNVFADEFMCGNNDRGKEYLEIENFFRNTEKVEKWLDSKKQGGTMLDHPSWKGVRVK